MTGGAAAKNVVNPFLAAESKAAYYDAIKSFLSRNSMIDTEQEEMLPPKVGRAILARLAVFLFKPNDPTPSEQIIHNRKFLGQTVLRLRIQVLRGLQLKYILQRVPIIINDLRDPLFDGSQAVCIVNELEAC